MTNGVNLTNFLLALSLVFFSGSPLHAAGYSCQYLDDSRSKLIKFVENWALIQNIENIFVSTQKENYAACQFYEKNKFIIHDTTYIYHVWNKS